MKPTKRRQIRVWAAGFPPTHLWVEHKVFWRAHVVVVGDIVEVRDVHTDVCLVSQEGKRAGQLGLLVDHLEEQRGQHGCPLFCEGDRPHSSGRGIRGKDVTHSGPVKVAKQRSSNTNNRAYRLLHVWTSTFQSQADQSWWERSLKVKWGAKESWWRSFLWIPRLPCLL